VPEQLEAVSLNGTHPAALCPRQESVFVREGDYWTIQYQGQIARFRATRGLYCLASLLQHPSQEFHVLELFAAKAEVPVAASMCLDSGVSDEVGKELRTVRFQDAGPILDARAKAEYARRLAELREELQDAERIQDPVRARRARQKRDYIVVQLGTAVGLGKRKRNPVSPAEHARSAVTKRVKESIHKIEEAMPPLGRHLAARIKTGYFCSYNPNPDRHVVWKVRS
jgi:hypothetical protein